VHPTFEELSKGQKLEVFFAEPGVWYEGCIAKKSAEEMIVSFCDGDEETISRREMQTRNAAGKKDFRMTVAPLAEAPSSKRERAKDLLQMLRVSC
jgi:hypothetical protein